MSDYLQLVDERRFEQLFIRELGWSRPRRAVPHTYQGEASYRMELVAEFKGLTVWVCNDLPSQAEQRRIDTELARLSAERLLIFCGQDVQDWRWPRRGRLGSVSNKLMLHHHTVGGADPDLRERIESMLIGIDEDPALVEMLARMRAVFDQESESASQRAARLMGNLYQDLENVGMENSHSTQFLARMLFLWFGDDAGMWNSNVFHNWLAEHTSEENLAKKLGELFAAVDDPRADRVQEGKSWELPQEFYGFPYINGGLFSQELEIPQLPQGFRDKLLEACKFDWSVISPAIFGSMFQTVKDSKARRAMGEHYTTETNILRTLRPLFLDELEEKFEKAKDDKGALTKLHNHLGKIKVMDPACGCGNFLIVAYRELRALELQIIARRRELDQLDGIRKESNEARFQLEGFEDTKVKMSNFAGIEIEDWPAAIAETAMLLVDHQANQDMAEVVGQAMVRLPIDKMNRANIVHANALRTNWHDVLPATPTTYVVGNPPFLGDHTRTKAQLQDLKDAWGGQKTLSRLDYVTAWHAKALSYFDDPKVSGSWAFVTTNSITQGDQTARLFDPIFEAGWRIRFAHQTFPWETEAADSAAVHCVIVGFDRKIDVPARLFKTVAGQIVSQAVANINGYLLPAENIHAIKRSKAISSELSTPVKGSMATDGGGFVLSASEKDLALADDIAKEYVKVYIGSSELINGRARWCLWLINSTAPERALSKFIQERIKIVAEYRRSSRAATTREYPHDHLFRQLGITAESPIVAIPEVSSENRPYFPVTCLSDGEILSNKIYGLPDTDGFAFAVLSSSMFITWQKAIGGRLESRLNFSNTVVWNNLPLPPVDPELRAQIIEAGKAVLVARALEPEKSLAQHYEPGKLSQELQTAHDALDVLVDKAFGATEPPADNGERLKILFRRYKEMASTSECCLERC